MLLTGKSAYGRCLTILWLCGANTYAQQDVHEASGDVDRQDVLQTIMEYKQALEASTGRGGPYDPASFELYFDLGHSYQSIGFHDQAIQAFQEANFINRVNNGLKTPKEVQLVKATIESSLALGEYRRVHEELQYLLDISEDLYGKYSQELVPILLFLAHTYRYELPDGINQDPRFRVSINASNNDSEPPMPDVLYLAQIYYARAIDTIVAGHETWNPDVPRLGEELLESIYQHAVRRPWRYWYQSYSHNNYGYYVYRGLLAYDALRDPPSQIDRARLMVGLGDWYLMYRKNRSALKQYSEAYKLLQSTGVSASEINDLLAPETPMLLPAFRFQARGTNIPGSGPGNENYDGHVDVTFDLSKYGDPKKIKVGESSGKAPASLRRELKLFLVRNRFRPVIAALRGEARTTYRIRYYFRVSPGGNLTFIPADHPASENQPDCAGPGAHSEASFCFSVAR